jgi:MFS family permease
VVLAVAAVSFLATTQSATSLTSAVEGQVDVGGGREVLLPVTVRVYPEAGRDVVSGTLSVGLKTSDGTQDGYAPDVETTLQDPAGVRVGDQGAAWHGIDLPVADCATGCVLQYRVAFTSLDAAAPPATLRFVATAQLGYGYSGQAPPADALTVEVAGAAQPVNAQWLAVAAMIAGLLGGLMIGRRVHGSGRRRYLPAVALGIGLLAAGVWAFLEPFTWTAPRLWDPVPLLGLGGALLWSVRRWMRGDAGWVAVAGIAVAVIGGIVFLGRVGLLTGFRPLELILATLVGWTLVGVVVGQGSRVRTRPSYPTLGWATAAVVSQSVILIGLTGSVLSAVEVFDAWPPALVPISALAIPALIAMPLVVWGWRRWIAGKGTVMATVNVLLLLIGAVGLWGLTAITVTGWNDGAWVTYGPAAVVSLGSCVVGFLAALHAPKRPAPVGTAMPAAEPSGPLDWPPAAA